MLGNIWEWTEDCWNANYVGAPDDDVARASGDCLFRVLRGGSWFSGPGNARSAYRDWYTTTTRDDYFGFRVARTL